MREIVCYMIKSESDEGRYYLVNGWNKYNTYWSNGFNPQRNGFKSKGLALRSLKHLLNIMPEYRDDKFSIVTFYNDFSVIETDDVEPIV